MNVSWKPFQWKVWHRYVRVGRFGPPNPADFEDLQFGKGKTLEEIVQSCLYSLALCLIPVLLEARGEMRDAERFRKAAAETQASPEILKGCLDLLAALYWQALHMEKISLELAESETNLQSDYVVCGEDCQGDVHLGDHFGKHARDVFRRVVFGALRAEASNPQPAPPVPAATDIKVAAAPPPEPAVSDLASELPLPPLSAYDTVTIVREERTRQETLAQPPKDSRESRSGGRSIVWICVMAFILLLWLCTLGACLVFRQGGQS